MWEFKTLKKVLLSLKFVSIGSVLSESKLQSFNDESYTLTLNWYLKPNGIPVIKARSVYAKMKPIIIAEIYIFKKILTINIYAIAITFTFYHVKIDASL